MPLRVTVRDADTGTKVEMDLEPHNTIEEIIESAASYWEKEVGAYVLRHGGSILRGQVFRWNFVEIVAPVVGGVCAEESAPAPEVYG